MNRQTRQDNKAESITRVPQGPIVLVVDDEPDVVASYQSILGPPKPGLQTLFEGTVIPPQPFAQVKPITVVTALQGEEAVSMMQRIYQQGGQVQLAFLDVNMPPGIDGLETAHRLRRIDPDLQIVVVTARADYPFEMFIKRLGTGERLFYLEKPFATTEVQQMTRSLLANWGTLRELKQTLGHIRRLAEKRAADMTPEGDGLNEIREMLQDVADTCGALSAALVIGGHALAQEDVIGIGLLSQAADLQRAWGNRLNLMFIPLPLRQGEGATQPEVSVVLLQPTQLRNYCTEVASSLAPFALHRLNRVKASIPQTSSLTAEKSAEPDPSLIEFHGMLTANSGMAALFEQIRRTALSSSAVFLSGETGTGKERVARAVHQESSRYAKPFVALNCANLTETLLESQLFGHRKGAFTGAVNDQPGLLAEANGGTLFLDEVAELPMALQAKLLRVLQEKEYTPLGETRPRSFDVRIISASQARLKASVVQGRFREDLFYRLHVIPLHIPALRDRQEDAVLLFRHFLATDYDVKKCPAPELRAEVLQVVRGYHWPGNVRELQNTCAYVSAFAGSGPVALDHLPVDLRQAFLNPVLAQPLGMPASPLVAPALGGERESPEVRQADPVEMTPEMIRAALTASGGRRAEAARKLGISRMTLWRKLREFGL